jgi:hypothetical protein
LLKRHGRPFTAWHRIREVVLMNGFPGGVDS